jgi:hypothetical protein
MIVNRHLQGLLLLVGVNFVAVPLHFLGLDQLFNLDPNVL